MTFQEISTLICLEFEDIERINKVVNEHPIAWKHIADLVEEGIPLIDYMGPDVISYVVNKEKKIRHLPATSSYDTKCGFNEWEYDDKNMESIDEPNR